MKAMTVSWIKAHGALLGTPQQEMDALVLIHPQYTMGSKVTLWTSRPGPLLAWQLL